MPGPSFLGGNWRDASIGYQPPLSNPTDDQVIALETSDPPIPFSRQWMSTVLAAWSVAPILLWQNGLIPQEANAQPFNRGWVNAVRQSWEPEAQQQQKRSFVVQGSAAVVDQPHSSRVNDLIAAWWQAQEQPPVQKRLGIIQSVDDPPFGAKSWVEAASSVWIQDWPAPQRSRYLVQGAVVAADAPPVRTNPSLRIALDAWKSNDLLIWQSGFEVQGVAAVDAPPIHSAPWGYVARQSWDPPEPWPVQPRRDFTPGTVAPAGDAPPFGAKPWVEALVATWAQDWPAPQRSRYLAQGAIVTADAPPPHSRPWISTLNAAWNEPIEITFLLPTIPNTDIVDNPPFGQRSWLEAVIASWEPESPRAKQAGRFPQSGAATVNDPPFGSRPWVEAAAASWIVDWPAPQRIRYQVQPTAQAADDPPFGAKQWLEPQVATWLQDWQAQRSRTLPQGAAAGAADNPPFGAKFWAGRLVDTWIQEWPAPQQPSYLIQPATSPTADNPPFGAKLWVVRVASGWEEQWLGQRRIYLPQIAVATADNPPFGLRPWLRATLDSWELLLPRAAQAPRLVQSADQPPFAIYRTFGPVLEAWQPAWIRTLEKRKLIQPVQVDNPPFGAKPWAVRVIYSWQPGPPDIKAPLGYRFKVPPTREIEFPSDARTYHVIGEDRVYLVVAEDRVYLVMLEDRDLEI